MGERGPSFFYDKLSSYGVSRSSPHKKRQMKTMFFSEQTQLICGGGVIFSVCVCEREWWEQGQIMADDNPLFFDDDDEGERKSTKTTNFRLFHGFILLSTFSCRMLHNRSKGKPVWPKNKSLHQMCAEIEREREFLRGEIAHTSHFSSFLSLSSQWPGLFHNNGRRKKNYKVYSKPEKYV